MTTLINRGILLEEQEDTAGALVDYTNVIRLNPQNDKAYNNCGGLLKKKGDFDGAFSDFNAAIRLNPSSQEAYANRGVIHMSFNKLKKAQQELIKVLHVAPPDWPFQAAEQVLADVQTRLKRSKQ
jgi:lipoprotein NlpI